jgi:hypothetical protein
VIGDIDHQTLDLTAPSPDPRDDFVDTLLDHIDGDHTGAFRGEAISDRSPYAGSRTGHDARLPKEAPGHHLGYS